MSTNHKISITEFNRDYLVPSKFPFFHTSTAFHTRHIYTTASYGGNSIEMPLIKGKAFDLSIVSDHTENRQPLVGCYLDTPLLKFLNCLGK